MSNYPTSPRQQLHGHKSGGGMLRQLMPVYFSGRKEAGLLHLEKIKVTRLDSLPQSSTHDTIGMTENRIT